MSTTEKVVKEDKAETKENNVSISYQIIKKEGN